MRELLTLTLECVSDEIDAKLHEVVDDVTEVFIDAAPPG